MNVITDNSAFLNPADGIADIPSFLIINEC